MTANTSLLDAGVKEVSLVPADQPTSDATGITSLIVQLAERNVSVDQWERIIAMQKDIMAMQAKSAFDAAFAEMQNEIPVIIERGTTNTGTYAPLEDIIETVRPILAKHRFSISHKTSFPDPKMVRVVGILKHAQGHQEESEFISAADTSGSKNGIQAFGSAISYGRRYTVKDLLGIVERKEDDDGKKSGRAPAPAPPDGFEAWWAVLSGLASDGTSALDQAWKSSKVELKNYTLKHRTADYNALKAAAAKVRR